MHDPTDVQRGYAGPREHTVLFSVHRVSEQGECPRATKTLFTPKIV